jgi:N-acetyl-gamma-glutamyl-phosphate reductase
VQIVDATPRLKNVVASNFCHIGLAVDDDTVVVMSVLDNLVKGAAGGAVQWMNRLWKLPETTGLLAAAPGWV